MTAYSRSPSFYSFPNHLSFLLHSLSGLNYKLVSHFSFIILQLANIPTPIHRWKIPDLPNEFEVFIKRDDITGSGLSGNKVSNLYISYI